MLQSTMRCSNEAMRNGVDPERPPDATSASSMSADARFRTDERWASLHEMGKLENDAPYGYEQVSGSSPLVGFNPELHRPIHR
jgi:hypothetical protein